jgi:hypothetical protein
MLHYLLCWVMLGADGYVLPRLQRLQSVLTMKRMVKDTKDFRCL